MPPNQVKNTTKLSSNSAQPLSGNPGGGGGSVRNQPRREFSARTKAQAWERANGFCEGLIVRAHTGNIGRCDAPIDLGEFHYDHIDPDWFSKDNELDNCQVLCRQCHIEKTKLDVKHIAKSKRIIKKRIKAKAKKRGFRGWRKFDGTVVHAKR